MDRNHAVCANHHKRRLSLSARRAWIEIVRGTITAHPIFVALRKESVDRNVGDGLSKNDITVALRKESVDRNRGS